MRRNNCYSMICFMEVCINSFHATSLYQYLLKTSETRGIECHVYSEIVQSFSVKKARPATFLKKRLNFEKFLKTPILIEQHRWLLLFIHFTTHELKGPRFVIALMLLKNIIDDIPIYLFNICKFFNQLSSFLSFL